MRVVAFNGSPRRNGNTAILIEAVLEPLAAAGIETEHVQLAGARLAGCIGCGRCHETKDLTCRFKDDVLNTCIEKMVAADGIIIGSPVYFADLTTNTKALIERAGYVTRGADRALRRKVGAAVVAVRRGGAVHTFDSINHFFQISEMVVVGSRYWNLGIGEQSGTVREDQEGLETMRVLGDNMAWVLQRLHG
jgi:multimeric flavodoxin WrbA